MLETDPFGFQNTADGGAILSHTLSGNPHIYHTHPYGKSIPEPIAVVKRLFGIFLVA